MISHSDLPQLPDRVAVFGPGLLGGSVLLALRDRSPNALLSIWGRRREPVDSLLSEKIVNVGTTSVRELFADPESAPGLAILATPVGIMPDLAREIAAAADSGEKLIVTDVGSTKQNLIERLDPIFSENPDIRFVGSHPMAGSEKTGLENAQSDLFEKAACILTPTSETDAEAVDLVDSFWQHLGCETHRMSPDGHDQAVAKISHLPHIAAAALVRAGLGDDPDSISQLAEICGGGFRDTTRIAGGHPKMWAEILLENRQSITESLRDLIQQLEAVQSTLERSDSETLVEFLETARKQRDNLPS